MGAEWTQESELKFHGWHFRIKECEVGDLAGFGRKGTEIEGSTGPMVEYSELKGAGSYLYLELSN